MKYKGLAIDLDGTLLVGEDLPDANLHALKRALDHGLAIIIATARWKEMAERIANAVGITGPAIACSGAQVFDLGAGQDIFDHRLPVDFTQALFDICDNHRCIATVTVEDKVLLKLDGEPDMAQMGDEMHWQPKLASHTTSLPRIAAIQGSKVVSMIKNELWPAYKDRVNIFDSIGPNGKLVITITSKSASKGAALACACDHIGLEPKDFVAFGDAENDLAMFEIAGASVAMGQAEQFIKERANYVTDPNTQAGVATAVNKLLAGNLL